MDIELATSQPSPEYRGSSERDIIRSDVFLQRSQFKPPVLYTVTLLLISIIYIGVGTIQIVSGVIEPNKNTCIASNNIIGTVHVSNIGIVFGTIDLFFIVCTICDYIMNLKNINKCFHCQKICIGFLSFVFVFASTVIGWVVFSVVDESCSTFIKWAIFMHNVSCSSIIAGICLSYFGTMIYQFCKNW